MEMEEVALQLMLLLLLHLLVTALSLCSFLFLLLGTDDFGRREEENLTALELGIGDEACFSEILTFTMGVREL